MTEYTTHAFIPLHAGHWTEPLTKHLTDERVTPRDPQQFHLQMEAATKGSMFSPHQAVDDMACFYDAHHWEAPLYKVWDKVCVTRCSWHSQVLLDHKGDRPSVVHSLISCCAKGVPRHWLQLVHWTYLWSGVWVFWVSRAQAWGWFWRMFHKGAGICKV